MATKRIRTNLKTTAADRERTRAKRRLASKELPNLDGPPTLRSERVLDALHGMRVRDVAKHTTATDRWVLRSPTLAELQDNLRDVDAKLGVMMFASAAEIEAARTARAGIRSAIAWLQEVRQSGVVEVRHEA